MRDFISSVDRAPSGTRGRIERISRGTQPEIGARERCTVETVGHQGFGTSSDATNRALGGSVDGARGVVAKFPSLANPLSRMKLNATMVKEVKANHKIVRPGGLVMSLNGENLELDTIDIYTLTETISRRLNSRRRSDARSSDAVISEVLRLPKRSRKGVKIDTTSPVFAFYNDVEKDARYATWSKDVRKLLGRRSRVFRK